MGSASKAACFESSRPSSMEIESWPCLAASPKSLITDVTTPPSPTKLIAVHENVRTRPRQILDASSTLKIRESRVVVVETRGSSPGILKRLRRSIGDGIRGYHDRRVRRAEVETLEFESFDDAAVDQFHVWRARTRDAQSILFPRLERVDPPDKTRQI